MTAIGTIHQPRGGRGWGSGRGVRSWVASVRTRAAGFGFFARSTVIPEPVIPKGLRPEGSRAGVMRVSPSRDPSEQSSFGMTAWAAGHNQAAISRMLLEMIGGTSAPSQPRRGPRHCELAPPAHATPLARRYDDARSAGSHAFRIAFSAAIHCGMYAGKPIIGIAGGIGSGKSFVAGLFGRTGGLVVDSDALVRSAYEMPR